MGTRLDSDRRVAERLARSGLGRPWAEPVAPSAVDPEFDDELDVDGDSAADGLSITVPARSRIPGQRRSFGRRQLVVVCLLVATGLLLTGWAVLRARPVALASPISEPVSGASVRATPATTAGTAAGTTAATGSTTAAATAAATTTATPSVTPSAPLLEVHVLGAVRRPGVVRLAPGSRVNDAIKAAGGLTQAAAPGQLNLAQPLGDGQQLFLARRGQGRSELRDPTPTGASASQAGGGSAPESSGSAGGAASTSGTGTAAKVDLNSATEADLDALPGIGPVTAGKIIAWRTQHGRFSKIDELQEVDGIGPKTYADLASRVTV